MNFLDPLEKPEEERRAELTKVNRHLQQTMAEWQPSETGLTESVALVRKFLNTPPAGLWIMDK